MLKVEELHVRRQLCVILGAVWNPGGYNSESAEGSQGSDLEAGAGEEDGTSGDDVEFADLNEGQGRRPW